MEVDVETSVEEASSEMPQVEGAVCLSTSLPSPSGSSSLRHQILQRATESDGHFKHQQRGEPDLTSEEKLEIASDLLDHKPSIFLSRFGSYLYEEDLKYFQNMTGDYTIDFHLREIRERLKNFGNKKLVKNRRLEAMRRLSESGDYFSDEEMKRRDPLLYEQMIGQYLSYDEVQSQIDKSDMRLSNILLGHIQMTQNNEVYSVQKAMEVSECVIICTQ